ncbi:MAG: ABC transporter substrate-binding protein [Pseudohongiella sp.]|nr:ABC transporter substrate-binding protein [Pseudohongiella sp.]
MKSHRPTCLQPLLMVLLLAVTAISVAADAPERIISTDAGATEILIALGAGQTVIGLDDSSRPLAGSDVPRLGYHRALAAEGIIALAPDLVIGSTQMGAPHVLEALQRSHIAVIQLTPPLTTAALRANIVQLTHAVRSDTGQSLLAQFDEKLADLPTPAQASELKAAFVLRAQGGMLRMAGVDTAGHAFIQLIAANNLADYEGYRSLSPEALLTLQPDILLFADTEGRDAAGLLSDMPLLRFSKAYQNQRLLVVDPTALVSGLSMAALDEALRVYRAIQP